MSAIMRHEGKILDGRSRRDACEAAQKPARYETLPPGTDPLAYAISQNLYRRHLSESQRAMVASAIANHRRGGHPGSQGATVRIGDAARIAGVSTRAVERARTVRRRCDQAVVQAVVNGEVSVRDAERAGTRPREEQRRAIDAMRNGKGRTLTASLDLFENMDRAPPAGNGAKAPETPARANGATGTPVPVAVPTIAEAERARKVLERIDLDPIASDASNAIVKAARAAPAERPGIEWKGTAWVRIAHDAHALGRVAECVDAVTAGALESVLVDLPSATCVHAPAQELLAIAERLVVRAGTPSLTVLAGNAVRGRGRDRIARTEETRLTEELLAQGSQERYRDAQGADRGEGPTGRPRPTGASQGPWRPRSHRARDPGSRSGRRSRASLNFHGTGIG